MRSLLRALTSHLLLLLVPATLHASVGKVIYAAGVVSLQRGTTIPLSKGNTLGIRGTDYNLRHCD